MGTKRNHGSGGSPHRPPVFIVGCGRSGTTALGRALQRHPDVTYLNEPRDIWGIDPRTVIWSENRAGRLVIDDVDAGIAERIRDAFDTATAEGTLLVEKTPINAFRIGLLRTVFPDGRILHLIRDGRDVARSIGRWVDGGRLWYGHNDAKWRLLASHARSRGCGHLVELCGSDPVLRGLLEWRLAVEHVQTRLRPTDLEVRYEHLMADPAETLRQIIEWTGLTPDPLDAHDLARRSSRTADVLPGAQVIAGELLHRLGYAD